MSYSTPTKHDGRAVLFAVAELVVVVLGVRIGVVRGYSRCTCTPQGGEKHFSGLIYRKNV